MCCISKSFYERNDLIATCRRIGCCKNTGQLVTVNKLPLYPCLDFQQNERL